MLRKIIGDNLKRFRKRTNLSQHEVALKTGMEQKTISKIENYLENIGIDKLDQLCRGLEISPYELLIDPREITEMDLMVKRIFSKGVIVMLYRYHLLLSTVYNKEISDQPYKTYGIGMGKQSIPCIKDICTDKAFVESLVHLCNLYQVSPEHLINVIDDAMLERMP